MRRRAPGSRSGGGSPLDAGAFGFDESVHRRRVTVARTREDEPMKIGVFGTGMVGRTIAAKLLELGHGVFIGTRDPAATMARADKDRMGTPPFKVWKDEHPSVELGTIAQAAAHGELLVNGMSGVGSLETLRLAGDALAGKVLLDISN